MVERLTAATAFRARSPIAGLELKQNWGQERSYGLDGLCPPTPAGSPPRPCCQPPRPYSIRNPPIGHKGAVTGRMCYAHKPTLSRHRPPLEMPRALPLAILKKSSQAWKNRVKTVVWRGASTIVLAVRAGDAYTNHYTYTAECVK